MVKVKGSPFKYFKNNKYDNIIENHNNQLAKKEHRNLFLESQGRLPSHVKPKYTYINSPYPNIHNKLKNQEKLLKNIHKQLKNIK